MFRLVLIVCALMLASCSGDKTMVSPFAIIVPKEDAMLAQKGEKMLREGNSKEAAKLYEDLHLRYPKQPLYMIGLADAMVAENNLERANYLYKEALKFPLEKNQIKRIEAGQAKIYSSRR